MNQVIVLYVEINVLKPEKQKQGHSVGFAENAIHQLHTK